LTSLNIFGTRVGTHKVSGPLFGRTFLDPALCSGLSLFLNFWQPGNDMEFG